MAFVSFDLQSHKSFLSKHEIQVTAGQVFLTSKFWNFEVSLRQFHWNHFIDQSALWQCAFCLTAFCSSILCESILSSIWGSLLQYHIAAWSKSELHFQVKAFWKGVLRSNVKRISLVQSGSVHTAIVSGPICNLVRIQWLRLKCILWRTLVSLSPLLSTDSVAQFDTGF